MGIQNYTIQKGDTLTKIAQEHYGLKGNEAYKKALEIAKENNIANPNLIHAGVCLNLFFEDKPAANKVSKKQQNVMQEKYTVEHKNENPEADVINTYKELMDKQKNYIQYQDAQELYAEEPKDFDPKTDTTFRFADAAIFETNDVTAKVKAYAAAALNLAEQDIKANDTKDKNGKKDGKISYEEFEKSEMKFFETSQSSAMKLRAEDQFALEYLTEHGVMPSEDLIKEAGEQIYEGMLAQYKASLGEMFDAYDVDGSGFLDKTEIATGYVMMDASTTSNGKSINFVGDNDEILMSFDGEINFDDNAIYVKNKDEALEYQKYFGADYTPVYYTNDRIKEIHDNMFAA